MSGFGGVVSRGEAGCSWRRRCGRGPSWACRVCRRAPSPLMTSLSDAAAVLGVVDGEVGGVVDALAFNAQDPGKDAVKGAHPDVAAPRHPQQCWPMRAFISRRRLVGEGRGERMEKGSTPWSIRCAIRWVRTRVFPRTCSRDDHHGPFNYVPPRPFAPHSIPRASPCIQK